MILRNVLIKLGYDVDARGLVKADALIENTKRKTVGLSDQIGTVNSKLLKMARSAAIGFAVFKGGRFLIDTINGFQQLEAQLVTLIGNEAEAAQVFESLKENAVKMPFELKNITAAYVKLSSLGLKPSMDDMSALGDIAAGMGQDIDQMGFAVKAAATGMSKPLKKFGIGMKQSGKMVTLSFRDQKITVKKDAKAIKDAIVKIGKANFAGGMKRQMETIGGAFLNLMDNLSKFANEVGESGLSKEINILVRELTGVAGGSESLAEAMGSGLGLAVSKVTKLIKFMRRHSAELQVVLAIFAGAQMFKSILFFAKAGNTMRLWAKGLSPLTIKLAIVVAAIVLLGIAIEDLNSYADGKDSILGRFLGPNTSSNLLIAKQILIGIGVAIAVVLAVILGAPIIIAGVVALIVAAILMVWNSWDEFGQFFALVAREAEKLFNDWIQSMKDGWTLFSNYVEDIWNDILKYITDIIESAKKQFEDSMVGKVINMGIKKHVELVDNATKGAEILSDFLGVGFNDPAIDLKRKMNSVQNNKNLNLQPNVSVNLSFAGTNLSKKEISDSVSTASAQATKKMIRDVRSDFEGGLQ